MKLFRSHYLLTLATGLLLVLPHVVSAQGALASIEGAAQYVILKIVSGILGTLVWFAALLLNFAVNEFVIGFGNVFTKTGIGVAVDGTWVIVRDFVNLSFIFGFVYIGFKMILSSADSNTRRWLVNIILAALLVNFSLFIVKFAIDMSNQLATQIALNGLGQTSTTPGKVDLASEFMYRLGLAKIYGMSFEQISNVGWGYIFGTALLSLTAMFVFAAGGILIIMRFAALCLFMMLSPIMFMSWILPPLKDTFERFWSMFIGRALVAPIYLLFIYFSLQVLSGLQASVTDGGNGFSNPDWAGTFQRVGTVTNGAAVGNLGTLPFFILAAIFMGASVWAADKLGADGGSKAYGMGKSFAAKIRRTAVNNSAGFALRGVNKLSSKAMGGYENIDARLSTSRGGRLVRGALSVGTLGALSDKSVRGALGAGKKLSIDGSETAEDVDKRDTERRTRQTQTLEGIAIGNGLKEHQKRSAEEARRIAAGAAAGTVEVTRNGATTFVDESQLTAEERAARKKQDDNIAKMQRLAADMGIKQFEEMSESEQVAIAEFMSGSLTESVMKSDKISESQKGKISTKQKESILKSITDQNGNVISENLNNLSIRQIETLGDEFVSQNAALFNDSLFSDIKKSKKFTESQVGRYVGKRKTDLSAMVNNPATAHQAFTQTHRDPTNGTVQRKSRKSAEIAKLPGDVLANPNSVQYLTVDVLKAIASGDKEFERVSTQQREDIARMIKFENNRFLGANPQFKKAADYLKSPKGQESFFGN